MPDAGGQVGHLCTEKTQDFRFHALYCITPNVHVILWVIVSGVAVLTSIASPNTYFGHFIL